MQLLCGSSKGSLLSYTEGKGNNFLKYFLGDTQTKRWKYKEKRKENKVENLKEKVERRNKIVPRENEWN
jgi:hypothetical protein